MTLRRPILQAVNIHRLTNKSIFDLFQCIVSHVQGAKTEIKMWSGFAWNKTIFYLFYFSYISCCATWCRAEPVVTDEATRQRPKTYQSNGTRSSLTTDDASTVAFLHCSQTALLLPDDTPTHNNTISRFLLDSNYVRLRPLTQNVNACKHFRLARQMCHKW